MCRPSAASSWVDQLILHHVFLSEVQTLTTCNKSKSSILRRLALSRGEAGSIKSLSKVLQSVERIASKTNDQWPSDLRASFFLPKIPLIFGIKYTFFDSKEYHFCLEIVLRIFIPLNSIVYSGTYSEYAILSVELLLLHVKQTNVCRCLLSAVNGLDRYLFISD